MLTFLFKQDFQSLYLSSKVFIIPYKDFNFSFIISIYTERVRVSIIYTNEFVFTFFGTSIFSKPSMLHFIRCIADYTMTKHNHFSLLIVKLLQIVYDVYPHFVSSILRFVQLALQPVILVHYSLVLCQRYRLFVADIYNLLYMWKNKILDFVVVCYTLSRTAYMNVALPLYISLWVNWVTWINYVSLFHNPIALGLLILRRRGTGIAMEVTRVAAVCKPLIYKNIFFDPLRIPTWELLKTRCNRFTFHTLVYPVNMAELWPYKVNMVNNEL